MAEVIFKYPLPFKDIARDPENEGTVKVLMPASAQVQSVLWQKDQIVVYSKVHVGDNSTKFKTFKVLATGQTFEDLEPSSIRGYKYWQFVGTVANNQQTAVYHVYHKVI